MPTTFTPPGKIDELSEAGKTAWHDTVNGYLSDAQIPPQLPFGGTRNQFFNPGTEDIAGDAVTKSVGWTAFPREVQITSSSDEERWRRADNSRGVQVEYCEWSVERNAGDKVTRITFTCEDREYWTTLAESDADLALEIYREHVSPNVTKKDLFNADGTYIQKNIWNNSATSGAMHMIARPNTIDAAVELAAGASVVRARPDGTLLTGARELITCGRYGARDRHSDPTIGEDVNELARAAHFVSLADPVQLAFESISFQGWKTPDNSNAADYWTYTRGEEGHEVRGVLEVPGDKEFVVGDMKINGEEIYYGGQVADFIRIKIVGLAHKLGQASIDIVGGCIGDPAAAPFVELSPNDFFAAGRTRAGIPEF